MDSFAVSLKSLRLSTAELRARLFTPGGSWRGWRCRTRCPGYEPSGCSRLCPSFRPSWRRKERRGELEMVAGEPKQHQSTPRWTRRPPSHPCPSPLTPPPIFPLISANDEPPDASWRRPTCSWRSSTASPCHSRRIPPAARRDWCRLCCIGGRSKHLGTWQKGGGGGVWRGGRGKDQSSV